MKKLIFDFDGTLVDSMSRWGNKMIEVLEVYTKDYPENVINIITPLGYIGAADYFIDELGIKIDKSELVKSMLEYAYGEYAYHIPAKDTVLETIQYLKSLGYSLNILTASPHDVVDVCSKRVGLYELFDNIWSCDDFGTTKSDEEIYHKAAKCLGTTVEDCVFFDDNVNAVKTANAAGMTVVGVYDKTSENDREEITENSYAYVEKMQQIIYILEQIDNQMQK